MKSLASFVVVLGSVLVLPESASAVPIPFSDDFESQTPCTIGATFCTDPCPALAAPWVNDTNDGSDWFGESGPTPSNGTGPSGDHTTGTGVYLYVEASGGTGCEGQVANLISPPLELGAASNPVARFWYHMQGAAMGTLHVDVSSNAGVTWDMDVVPTMTGSSGWQEAVVPLTAYIGQTVLIRLRAITGSSFELDIAIDDFQVTQESVCGDGMLEAPEVCDDGNTMDGDGCSADCLSDETCGNGIVDAATGEVCDDGNTMDGDGCSALCDSDETCGNGVVDVATGEQCDDGNTTDGDGCQGTCLLPVCGDGVLDASNNEVCDDGNTMDGDGCSALCDSDETCGNGFLDVTVGEACDDGNTVDGDGCQGNCALPACGDGILDPMEVCDDGNTNDGDGCSATCMSDETCGNGVMDAVNGEVCDDGNTTDGDGCSADCMSDETCGNGVLDAAVGEVCDDGNTTDGDSCSADCMSDETCGNGVLDAAAGEVCDDGNTTDGDGCSATCESDETCGNGFLDPAEACDDGNTADGDACAATCDSDETCGNGVLDTVAGEECDDGAANSDEPGACSDTCTRNPEANDGCGCDARGGTGGVPVHALVLAWALGLLWRRRRHTLE